MSNSHIPTISKCAAIIDMTIIDMTTWRLGTLTGWTVGWVRRSLLRMGLERSHLTQVWGHSCFLVCFFLWVGYQVIGLSGLVSTVLTGRVAGAPQMILQPIFFFFDFELVLHRCFFHQTMNLKGCRHPLSACWQRAHYVNCFLYWKYKLRALFLNALSWGSFYAFT